METHFYSTFFFFFFTRFFHMKIKKDSLLFFLMPCLNFQNHECKKKLEIREGRQDQWKTTSTPWIFFFLSLDFPYEHSERLPTIFFMPCQYFQKNECKKKLEIREGRQDQWKTTSTPWIFFFLSLDFPYEHSERLPTIFFMPCQYFQKNECKKKLEI